MSLIRRLTGFLRQIVYQAERERVDEKLSLIDSRIDRMEVDIAVSITELRLLREVFCANIEVVEQMLNAVKSSQEALSLVTKSQYGYLTSDITDLRKVICDMRESR